MTSAIILFAHGARDPEWANPIRQVREAILAADPALRVDMAFLEFMTPGLTHAANQLVAEGVEEIAILPMFIAQGGHLKRDVPLLIEGLRTAHPNVSFRLAPAVGEAPEVIAAMAAAARRAVQQG